PQMRPGTSAFDRDDNNTSSMPYAYLVRCSDDSYYAGSTHHLEQRLWEHNSAEFGAAYTRRRRPVELVWSGEFETIAEAFAFEKQIQGWSRAKREALIRGDYDLMPALARRGHLRPREYRKP
ncbi:MAG: excinuclease subunit, partial [Marmoricola sp.]|nr:excinuclease subunit [Marmoricola sp.]